MTAQPGSKPTDLQTGGDARALGAQRLASLSLDLDNAWSYMKTHGDEGWESFPSYLDPLIDIVLERLDHHGLNITFFIVGQDAALEKNREALGKIAAAGHEIGNHSFHHEAWLHRYSLEKLQEEFQRAEDAIQSATGQRPRGFRGPGFSLSQDTIRVLCARGYEYDGSTLPTYMGPLARAYYFWTSRNMSKEDRQERSRLFGTWKDGLRRVKPYAWQQDEHTLVEIPVTTIPLFKMPFHLSYLIYLATYSKLLFRTYLRFAITMCRISGTEPSFLLHPLDFIGKDVAPQLGFFPGMNMDTTEKVELFDEVMTYLKKHYQLVSMRHHAQAIRERATKSLPLVSAQTLP